jgi:DNA-binding transcriptional MocR family regulator
MKTGKQISWVPDLPSGDGSWAQRLADAIAAEVASGRLVDGERLPTQRALAQHLGVTPGTVNRAYAIAERAGLVTAEVGRGTFVRASSDTGIHDASLAREATGAIELGLNYPAGTEAEAALDKALSRLKRRDAGNGMLALSPYAGRPEHRAAGARWLRHLGLSVSGNEVLMCSGVQHGLAAALSALAAPGDAVLTEELTGPGIKALAGLHRLRLTPVAGDEHGLLPDALASTSRATGARVLYTMPTVQTPTTTTMPDDRRRAIAEVIRAERLVAIEDDAWGFLARGSVIPLRALAPDSVVYVTSVSKSLAPGLRVGYVAPPASLQRVLTSCLGALTWVAPLTAELVSSWIADGTAASIMEKRVRTAAERQRLAEELLGPRLVRSAVPTYHLWLPLPEPWRVDDFVAQAELAGVSLARTDIFVPGRAPTPHAVRICTGTEPSLERVERGLRIVARMLEAGPAGHALPGV